MKTNEKEIGKCDTCGQRVPKVFLKDCGLIGAICHPCYAEGTRKGRWDYPFFAYETESSLARLRRDVPKFPERFLTSHDVNSPEWPGAFTAFCTRKASWYGFADAFELFGECLK